MFKIKVLGFLFLISLTGCKTSRQTSIDTQKSVFTRESQKIVDTTRSISGNKSTMQVSVSEEKSNITNESEIKEQWDNWKKEWIDSTGNKIIETHETGNRTTTNKEQEALIRSIRDSLRHYAFLADYYRIADSLHNRIGKELTNTGINYSSQTKSAGYKVWKVIMYISIVLGLAFCSLWYIKKRKK